jgi:ABC-type nitrate/sulfonate/bicarbonate transport system ATPase subunit
MRGSHPFFSKDKQF